MASLTRDMRALSTVPCPVCRARRGERCVDPGGWPMWRGGHPTIHAGRRFDAAVQRARRCDECGAAPGAPCDGTALGYVHAARRAVWRAERPLS